MLRRFRPLALALALCISCIGSAAAVSDETATGEEIDTKLELATGYADELRELGLFKGTDQGYDLESPATRAQALTMLLRLMSLEVYAQAMPSDHPFTDLPLWCDRTVGYAYRSNLVNGVTPTTFAPNAPVNARTYLTLLLRALSFGADDGLTWDNTYAFAQEKKLIEEDEYSDDSEFLRSDLVILSHRTLGQMPKGSETSLLEQIKARPAFTVLDNGFVNTACQFDGYQGGDGTFPGQLVVPPQDAPARPTWEGTESVKELMAELNSFVTPCYSGLIFSDQGIRMPDDPNGELLTFIQNSDGQVGASVFSWRKGYASSTVTNQTLNVALEALRYLSGDDEVAFALWSWIDASNIRKEGADSIEFGFTDGPISSGGPTISLNNVSIIVDSYISGRITYWFDPPSSSNLEEETD